MRVAIMLLLAIMLLPLSVHAYGGNPGDIAVPSIAAPNMDMPKPLGPGPNMNMPGTKPAPLITPNKSLGMLENKSGNMSSDQNKVSQVQQMKTINAGGRWSISLDDGNERSLDLNLWPSSGSIGIMGFGSISDGGIENSVTASGSATEEELRLIAKLASPEHANLKYDECDLDLHKLNNTLSGTYTLRSKGQYLEEGNATAEMAPSS